MVSSFCSKSLATASPNAAEIEVELCPVPNTSQSLSHRLGKPQRPSFCLKKNKYRSFFLSVTYEHRIDAPHRILPYLLENEDRYAEPL